MASGDFALVPGRGNAAADRLRVQGGDLLCSGVPTARAMQVLLDALIDRGVHEHCQNHRRRTVDGHRHRGRGRAQVEARIELLHVIERCDRDSRVAGAAVNVRPRIGVFTVQRRRIECSRQPRRAVSAGQIVEAPVGAFRRPLPCKHARGILSLAPVGIHPAGIWIGTG